MSDYEQDLIDAAWPYWECEAEIAKRFYAKASDEDHIFYLRAQLWKELNPVDGFFNGLHKELKDAVDMYPKVDRRSIDTITISCCCNWSKSLITMSSWRISSNT